MMFKGGFKFTPRMRLHCKIVNEQTKEEKLFQVVNEIAVHRGQTSQLCRINCFVNDQILTNSVGDGIIVATPTGSTAYSLSCGGSMIHPSLQGILITPICPRSLSFRPLMLPIDFNVKLKLLKVKEDLNSIDGWAAFDGDRFLQRISDCHTIYIETSAYVLPTVNCDDYDWIRDINHQLMWNQTYSKEKAVINAVIPGDEDEEDED